MTGVHTLTSRVDKELAAEVQRKKVAWEDVERSKTYYFVDEETRREFEGTPAGKP